MIIINNYKNIIILNVVKMKKSVTVFVILV